MVFTCRWGILATGGIATKFCTDLLHDPKNRNVDDVQHKIVAISSSTSADRAQQFANSLDIPNKVDCYGTYEELVAHPDVDIIYVATPHSMHYDNCKLALEAGKSVLCEKAFTINEAQAKHLIHIAKEKELFLMEAVWTRFFPLCLDLQKTLFEDKLLGKVHRIMSDCSSYCDVDNFPTKHRLLNPDLGGGALLDIGVYALTWPFMLGYNDPDNKLQEPIVSSGMIKNQYTHVDETTNVSLVFPEARMACVATTSIRSDTPGDNICRVQGELGEITVQGAAFRPTSYTIHLKDKPSDKREFAIPSQMGMYYEADECARCLRDGKKQSDTMTLEESRVMMAVMDKVRQDGKFEFPAELERVEKF